jgi:flavin-dependent dehydrogenase
VIEADVVVLGGGPAGTAAAITAAAGRLRVVLCERSSFPRPAAGETTHPGVQPLLRQLGVEEDVLAAGFLRFPGHLVRSPRGEQFQPFGADADGHWLGFQLWRPTFDEILMRRAKSVGIRVLQPCRVHRVIHRSGDVDGVETELGAIRARITIDATGRRRLVSHELSIQWNSHDPPRHVWYGYVRGECPARAETPALTIDSSGWTWVARVRPEVFAWARLFFDASRPAEEWLPEELAGLESLGPMTGADVTWAIAGLPAGNGYFLVVDAASVLDPTAGHGLLKAVMTGIKAGDLAINVVAGSVSPPFAARHYTTWLLDWFHRDSETLANFYAGFSGS